MNDGYASGPEVEEVEVGHAPPVFVVGLEAVAYGNSGIGVCTGYNGMRMSRLDYSGAWPDSPDGVEGYGPFALVVFFPTVRP